MLTKCIKTYVINKYRGGLLHNKIDFDSEDSELKKDVKGMWNFKVEIK